MRFGPKAGSGNRRGVSRAFSRGPVHASGVLSRWPDAGRDCSNVGATRIERQPAAGSPLNRAPEAYSGGVANAGNELRPGRRSFRDGCTRHTAEFTVAFA